IQTPSNDRGRTRIAAAVAGQGKGSRALFCKRTAAAEGSRGTVVSIAAENQRAVVGDVASYIAAAAPDFQRSVRDRKPSGIVVVAGQDQRAASCRGQHSGTADHSRESILVAAVVDGSVGIQGDVARRGD